MAGLYGLRLELPFALDHVNIWLCAEHDGWTVIDAGLADEPTRERWRSSVRGLLAERPIRRVLATHYHPDHMVLAGWLCAETGAELWTSRTEWLTARLLAQDVSDEWVAAGRRFDMAPARCRADRGARGARQPVPPPFAPPPAAFRRVREGDRLRLGEVE